MSTLRPAAWLRRARIVVVLLVVATPCAAQTIDDVFPVKPEDGATVGPRPLLQVGVAGTDLAKMRFRIVMSRDDFETEHYVFDQLAETRGWAYAVMGVDDPGAVFFVPKPLEDGRYVWRADAWNGVRWVEGEVIYRLDVDGTRPADVDTLRLRHTGDGVVQLSWEPVVTDNTGAPEFVTGYRVYRFFRKQHFLIRGFQIGTTEFTKYTDKDETSLATGLLFYKVTAEDAAGNHKTHMPKWEHEAEQERKSRSRQARGNY